MITTIERNIDLKQLVTQVEKFVGNTPLIEIINLPLPDKVRLFAKAEWQQFGNSVKARPAFNIFKQAIAEGKFGNGKSLLDASSGNTGVAFGAIGSFLKIPVSLCLPENASEIKQASLKAFGVDIIYTSKFGGTDEAQEKAKELVAEFPDKYYYADQYANENNWKAHYNTTAPEIIRQTAGEITHFVAGLGTTGTFIGTSRGLKNINNDIQVIALHPDSALHGLEGWKHMYTAIVPKIYDTEVADVDETISTEIAYEWVKKIALSEGLLLSPSSAANLAGAYNIANQLNEGVVVTVLPDHGSNYPELIKELIN